MTSFKEVAETIDSVIQEMDAAETEDSKRRQELWRIYDNMMETDPALLASDVKKKEAKEFLEQSIPEIMPITSLLSRDSTAEVLIVIRYATAYIDALRFSTMSGLKECSIHLSKLKEYTPISLEDIPDLVMRKKVGKRIAKMRLAKMKRLGER